MLTHLTCFALNRCFYPPKKCFLTAFKRLILKTTQGECERGTEWKIEWGKKGHKFELPNKTVGKSVKDEL